MSARKPVLLAVDPDEGALRRIEEELTRRYGADYNVICQRTGWEAGPLLERCREAGDDVALVMADERIPGGPGSQLLARVPELFPNAKRALLIDWGAWGHREEADAIHRAMALGHIDYYVIKPWRQPDEFFNRTVAEFVHEWWRTESPTPMDVVVVGERWAPRSHELRDLLTRTGIPHSFHPSGSEAGRRLLDGLERDDDRLPVVFLQGGKELVDPDNAELIRGIGVSTELAGDESELFDLVVVGAGPAGLAAAVYASSEGLRTLVVEREAIGGQAASSSLIRNYLGFSRGVSGADLATRAYQQAWVFGTKFILSRAVTGLHGEDGRHVLTLSDGGTVTARAVVLATGVSYRRLGVAGLDEFAGAGVFYGATAAEARGLGGQRTVVVGGGNSAGQAAMHLCRNSAHVTLLVRGASLARSMSQYLRDEIDAASNIEVRFNTEVADAGGRSRLEWLRLRDRETGERFTVEAAALFVLIGARPLIDWLPPEVQRHESGYVMTGQDVAERGWPLERPPKLLETSLPGVFAVGDTRHRAVKRVASAVGEGSIAIQQVHEYLTPATEGVKV